MSSRTVLGFLCTALLLGALVAACAPAAAPAPTAAPTKAAAPAAQPTAAAAPAATAAKPAAEPTKPAAAPTKPAAAAPAGAVELRLGVSNAPGDILTQTADKLIELVNQKSKGTIQIRNFGQSLGVEQQLAQAVQSGSVDFGVLSNGNTGRFSDGYLIYDLPFLFKTYDALFDSLDKTDVGKKAIATVEKDMGVKVMMPTSFGWGRDIFSRSKLLKTPADIKGVKVRTVSTPVDMATFKAWGANPTPIDWGQTYAAVQQGVVDGLAPDLGAGYYGKFHEVAKYVTHVGYQAIFQQIFMNRKKFDSLTPDQQKILTDAAEEARIWNRKFGGPYIEDVIKGMKAGGAEFYVPTKAEWEQWASIRETVWNEVTNDPALKGKIDLNVAKQIFDSQK